MAIQTDTNDEDYIPTQRKRSTTLPPWDQPSTASLPSEDTIRENIIKHKKDILDSLNPSQLFELCFELDLDRKITSRELTRRQKAEALFDTVIEERMYWAFLSSLEVNSEHMGHRYIVSLLRGLKFAQEEEIKESKTLIQQMKEMNIQELNVDALRPYLQSEELLTDDEIERLQKPGRTAEKKARMLVSLLKTKGPTAHFIFVHKCLGEEDSHFSHRELYLQLTAQPETRKRRPSVDTGDASLQSTKVTRRYPCYLEPPEGVTTQSYIDKISQIRDSHQAGGEMWQVAEDTIQGIISSPENPLEMKIAFLLESCNQFVLARQPDKVIARVDQAREMCMKLYSSECNAQVLEGRCEWVLARLYKFKGDFDKARTHINTAFTLTAPCEMGEERILINFVNGSILLDNKTKSSEDLQQAIHSFECAISLASEEDYGMKMVQYCKIRLAQAYIGTSLNDPVRNREGVSQDNIVQAKRILADIDKRGMRPRTRWSYLLTCSDVYRLDEQLQRAMSYADQALKVEREHKLSHEVKSKFVETRQRLCSI